jgi:DNA-binding PadR family transcriptional regulator
MMERDISSVWGVIAIYREQVCEGEAPDADVGDQLAAGATMTNVFSHGRLRLYLLRLMADRPRHGYELIRLLEDQFMGLYAPSAGTIYPRLQRLEAEGLVTHSQEGGRKVYAITQAGRDELARRSQELAELEAEIRDSVLGMAGEIRAEVRDTVRDVKDELRRAARQMRRQQRSGWLGPLPWGEAAPPDQEAQPPPWSEAEPGPPAERLLPRVQEMVVQVAAAARAARPTDAQLRECLAILEEAFARIRAVLRDTRP